MIVQSGVVVYAQQTLEGWLVGLIPGYLIILSFTKKFLSGLKISPINQINLSNKLLYNL